LFLNGEPSNSVTVEVSDFAPGILLVAHAADGAPVSALQPAVAGEPLLIYATGLGAAANATEIPKVDMGGIPTALAVDRTLPWTYGVVLLKIQVPQGVPAAANVPLTLSVGGLTASIQVAVR